MNLNDSERYRRLNDVVCVCVGEVRDDGDPNRDSPDLVIDTVAELIWRTGCRMTTHSYALRPDQLRNHARTLRASLERVRTQEPHLLLVETCLHPAQHDVVDALLVAQFEERLAPPADESE